MAKLLSAPSAARPCPDSDTLRRAFRVRETRTQRKSDGTISVEGVRFEVPSRLRQGKSVALRIVDDRLSRMRDVVVRSVEHPQSAVSDFYRELGDLFGVALTPRNRWGGFKAIREKWQAHIEATLIWPVLIIDEAQEMPVMQTRSALPAAPPCRAAAIHELSCGDRRPD